MAYAKAAAVSEIPPGTSRQVALNGKSLAVFNIDGSFYAIDNDCPHRAGPLSEGEVQGTQVECPWHAARFDLTTGAALCAPAKSAVKVYKVQVMGQEVQVDV